MASFNKITIVGYLGRDPELRYTPSGDAVCSFSVATTERKKDANGEAKDETTWFRITTWRRQAEVANEYLRKGSQIYIEGKLRMSEFTDREGNTRQSLEVTASDLQFIGTREGATYGGGESESKGAHVGTKRDPQSPVNDDEIPF